MGLELNYFGHNENLRAEEDMKEDFVINKAFPTSIKQKTLCKN